jgi:aspartate aminotransferase
MAKPRLMDQMTCHIPNRYVENAIRMALDSGEYQCYPPPMGLPNLHKLVLKDFELEDSDAKVCVTDGSLPAIYQTIMDTCHPEQHRRFIDSEPAWGWPRKYSQREPTKIEDKISPSDITSASDFINICSPQNPVGFDYTNKELEALAKKARKVDAWVLFDCTYKDYSEYYYPMYKIHPEKTITTWSMSKSPGMAGMRVGGVICSEKNMNKMFTLRPNQLGSNLPGQRAACAALDFKRDWLPTLLKQVDENRQYIYKNLTLGNCPKPDKGNSVWIEFPESHDSSDITAALKAKDIQVRDGIYYKGWGFEGNFIKVGIAVPHEWIMELVEELNAMAMPPF